MTPAHAQRAIDMFNEAATAFVAEYQKNVIQVWNKTQRDWEQAIMAHPTLGGAAFPVVRATVARVRDALVSDHRPDDPRHEKDMGRLNDMLRITGVGNHPVFWEMLHRAARYIDEGPPPAPNAKPTPHNGVNPNSRSIYTKVAVRNQ